MAYTPRPPNRARKPAMPVMVAKMRKPRMKGRKLGTIVDYDANQRQRYRSQYARYLKALEIVPDGVDDTNPRLPTYLFGSNSRGGSWRVESFGYGSFACNCPDYIKQERGNPTSDYDSSQVDRNWQNSSAGAIIECKHIIAVKLFTNVFYQVPKDPTLL